MRARTLSCFASLLLAACSGEPAVPAIPAPPVTAEETPTPEPLRYTIASRLNLRSEASADAPKVGTLAINSRVVLLGTEGAFARIRTGNGVEAWVSAEFLGEKRLNRADAVEEARQHPGAEGLVWWQRAAAILAEDRTVMRGLADAYRASGDEENAAQVEQRLKWPEAIVPVALPRLGTVEVERLSLFWEGELHRERPRTLTAAERRRLTLSSDESWWVLPDVGPAVRARVQEHRMDTINPCDGDHTVLSWLSAPLPADRIGVAATLGTPPESWSEAVEPPRRSRAEANALIRQALDALGETAGATPRISLMPEPGGWAVTAIWDLPEARHKDCGVIPCGFQVVRLSLADSGAVAETGRREVFDLFPVRPVARRDVDGDGEPDLIETDGCATTIRSGTGALLARTKGRCCGC